MFQLRHSAGFVGLCAIFAAIPALSEECATEAGSSHHVQRVIDGETLLLDDGREVRLVGALAPEQRQSADALRVLVADRLVALRYDGRQRDRYGHLLAQVYAASPDGPPLWVQKQLIDDGHALAYALPGNTGCIRLLVAAEDQARQLRRGLWQSGLYQIHDADDVAALSRMQGHFVLVEGRVTEVSRRQKTTYINFGADWRRDFTASLATSILDEDGGAERVDALAGKRVRVRGWIERRNGPLISLNAVDEIEILDAEGPASGTQLSRGEKNETGPR